MYEINILFWLLPLLLIIVFLRRYSNKSSKTRNNVLSKSQTKSGWVWMTLIIIVTLIIIGSHNSFKIEPGCKNIICPEEFVEIIYKNENQIAEVFINKGATSKISEGFDENSQKYIVHSFWMTQSFFADFESAYMRSDVPGWILYVFDKKKNYEEFFTYLKTRSIKLINREDYKNSDIIPNFPSYEYKNCVFVNEGYISENKGYCLEIFQYELLHNKLALDNNNSIKNTIVETIDGKPYIGKDESDFIRFFKEKDSVYKFTGMAKSQALQGKVKVNSYELSIISGNCRGYFVLTNNNSGLTGAIKLKDKFKDYISFEYHKAD